MYFKKCKTLEELKKEYKKIAKELHPDNPNGDTQKFQAMQDEFKKIFDELKNTHQNYKGEYYQKETTQSCNEFMDFIDKLINLSGVVVDLVGSWVWLTGNTKDHKDTIKKLGFKFSPKKCAWYWHDGPFRKASKKNYSLDELKAMFTSETLNDNFLRG